MASRSAGVLSRALRAQRTPQLPRAAARFYSSAPEGAEKRPSIVGNFYKTFTRPVLKVLLMATLTYQIAYWSWIKLEQDEIREDKKKEIEGLEAKVAELQMGRGSGA
ncbi:hypothetical protein CSOJ01_04879 [Colletotrichum sojae]|uniref:Inner membrane assembly complex subunit 17 n=1 Tax=Colletotrichum sojae TaxID=2175907 RepID=A0A8H6JGT3_9PEZI|nr:hypothetical protein CSOJ01_04879 [Colletotrichum sojae]